MSPGKFSFGGGIEGRLGTEYRFGESGDTVGGGASAPSKIFPWAILRLRYLFGTGSEARFLTGAHLGVGAKDEAYPSREAGLFLGVRY
jgi:hypothetical protein